MQRGWPQVPGSLPGGMNPYLSAEFVRALNVSGANRIAGECVTLNVSAANHVAGGLLPFGVTDDPDNLLALGVIAPGESTIPDGAACWVQVAGLHPSALVSGALALVAGDPLSTSLTEAAMQLAANPDNYLGFYVDDNYSTAAAAAKKVFLVNRLGLRTTRPY